VAAKGAKSKTQSALGEVSVVFLSDGGFNSPRLHQIIYHTIDKIDFYRWVVFILPETPVNKPFLHFCGAAFIFVKGVRRKAN